ncbi:MAG: hypothetical protein U0822_16950 [Anaerolineae bacterium]
MGHEAPQVAEAQVISISSFEEVLSSVHPHNSKLFTVERNEHYMLQAGKATPTLITVIEYWVEDHGLQSATPMITALIGGNNVVKLIHLTGTIGYQALKIDTVMISGVLLKFR